MTRETSKEREITITLIAHTLSSRAAQYVAEQQQRLGARPPRHLHLSKQHRIVEPASLLRQKQIAKARERERDNRNIHQIDEHI